MRYGFKINWTNFDGTEDSVKVSGCLSQNEAIGQAVTFALDAGWTYPKWWQWWRWYDTRIPQ